MAGFVDPNATALNPTASDATPLEGLIADPNGTSLSGSLIVDPVVGERGAAPATELMYAVQDVAKLAVASDVSGDQTPVRAARFRVIAEKGIDPSSTDPAAIDPSERPITAAMYAVGEAVVRHRLAIVGLIGMLLAFVIGIVLARWAAQEVRPRPVITVPHLPLEKQKTQQAPQAPQAKKYPHLDVLLANARANPEDAERMRELRDGILEASNDVADEKRKVALRRKASSAARTADMDALASCIEELRLGGE
jgi:hypothetical protein